jgi:hypothetical protein
MGAKQTRRFARHSTLCLYVALMALYIRRPARFRSIKPFAKERETAKSE